MGKITFKNQQIVEYEKHHTNCVLKSVVGFVGSSTISSRIPSTSDHHSAEKIETNAIK